MERRKGRRPTHPHNERPTRATWPGKGSRKHVLRRALKIRSLSTHCPCFTDWEAGQTARLPNRVGIQSPLVHSAFRWELSLLVLSSAFHAVPCISVGESPRREPGRKAGRCGSGAGRRAGQRWGRLPPRTGVRKRSGEGGGGPPPGVPAAPIPGLPAAPMPGCPRRVRVGRPPAPGGREGRGRALLPGCLPGPLRKRSGGWRGRTRRPAGVPQESLALAVAAQGGRGGHGHAAEAERGREAWRGSHPLLPGGSVFPSTFLSQQRVCQTQRTCAEVCILDLLAGASQEVA